MMHNQPTDHHCQDDEQTTRAVTDLLQGFAEQPSKAFHARHVDAAWVRAAAPDARRLNLRRAMLLTGFVGLLVALWFSVPSGLVAAVSEFFGMYRAPTDTVDSAQGPFMTAPSVATLAEASTLVGFEIRTPAQLPATVTKTEITIAGEQPEIMVPINYLDDQDMSQVTLSVKQGPLLLQIGASATVEVVQLGNVNGEYVMGGFITGSQSAQWDPNYPMKYLRWQVGDASYMLSSARLSKQGLIDLAVGMQ